MRIRTGAFTAARTSLSAAVVVCLCCLTGGCCCCGVPSARFNEPTPYSAPTPAAATVVASTRPTAVTDAGCVVPVEGYVGADECPSLLAWPWGLLQRCCQPLRRCCGPLFHPGRVSGGGEAEAELYPPHSRFHPVPSAPVFAQRYDYAPPDRMMVPLPAHPRLAPHVLPHVPGVQPLTSGGGVAGPAPQPVPERVPEPVPEQVPMPVPVEPPAGPFADPAAEPAVEPPAGNRLPQPLPDPPSPDA